MARFTEEQMRKRFESGKLNYKGFVIEAKRDYADVLAYDQGFYLRDGFVVVKDGCNATPGAGWFKSVREAKEAIDILAIVGERGFHKAAQMIREAQDRAKMEVLEEIERTFA